MTWNYIDLLLIAIVLLNGVLGWQRGALGGALDLLRLLGSFVLGLLFYQPVAHWISTIVGWTGAWTSPLAFVIIVIVTSMVIQALGYAVLRQLPQQAHRHIGNRLLGIIPGTMKGLVVATVTAALLLIVPLPDELKTPARASTVANQFAGYTSHFREALAPIFDEALAQTLHTITVQPESDESVALSCTVTDAPPDPSLEAQMLELVNQERAEAGRAPLAADPALTEVARQHSADMFARGYFSHITPEGRSPFDRIRAAGISYSAAGENLALAPTLSLAHTGLMNSPGHRANILQTSFGRVGIGILDGGACGLMVTQKFRD